MPVKRGQALVLFALTLLLITLMVMMTVSFGMAAARKTDLNNAADATAYAAAVETARTFNSAAMLNRAIIAHYVTIAGIDAQMAYVSEGHALFNLAATQFRMFDMSSNPVRMSDVFQGLYDPSGGCADRTWETRDASYELWHADLFYFSPSPSPLPGDNIDGYCVHGVCPTRHPMGRGDGWNFESVGQLEKRAGVELHAVHRAIHDLARIERATYRELYDRVRSGSLAHDVADAMKIDANVAVAARPDARDELNQATRSNSAGTQYGTRSRGFEHGFADAVMGTRPRERLQLPGPPENPAPLFRQLRDFVNAAFAAYPGGQVMWATFGPSDVTSDYTFDVQDGLTSARVREEPMGPPNVLEPGMGHSYGRAQGGLVVTRYADACAGRTIRTVTSGQATSPRDPVTGQRYETLPMGVLVRGERGSARHTLYESGYGDGAHAGPPTSGGGCHGAHTIYGGEPVEDVHAFTDDTLPEEILAFVLADPAGSDGAHGAWGQPVVPVVLSKRFPLKDDPWALDFHFGFTSAGADLDLASQGRVTTASAAGVAHYHRRGHLGEPANLLNPFWRATLQPVEVDQRLKKFDPSRGTQVAPGQMPMVQVLQSQLPQYDDAPQAKAAYQALRDQVHGMQKHPGDGSGVVR